MITLFIDTSSTDVSIAILKDEKVISSICQNIPNQHSIYTVSFLEKMIKDAGITPNNIEKILVVTGPGSFTGLRIGVTISKVYAYLKNLSIIGVSSLKIKALSCEHKYCLSIMDARHNHYYAGLYDEFNNEVIKEGYYSKEYIKELILKYNPILVGDNEYTIEDKEVIKPQLDFSKIISYYQNMPSINPHLVVPNYLKLPQALEDRHD